jgi:hypothetical protein
MKKNVNTEMGSSLKKLKQLFLNIMRQTLYQFLL